MINNNKIYICQIATIIYKNSNKKLVKITVLIV